MGASQPPDTAGPGIPRALPFHPGPQALELLAALRHDLGKYASLALRWLPPGASTEELREALRDDLLRTRRGGTLTESAPELWARFRPLLLGERPLPGGERLDLRGDPDFEAADRAVARIAAALPELDRASRERLEALRAEALRLSCVLSSLLERARAVAGRGS